MTKVVDLDVMHNMTTLNVTPTSEAQTIIPESPVDGYSQVNVAAVPVPSTFSVNITATKTTDTTLDITTDKTFSETMQAFNNGDNVVITLTLIADGTEGVLENVCCGIAHSSTSPYNAFIYITVEAEEAHSGPMFVHWFGDSNTATVIPFSSSYFAIGS